MACCGVSVFDSMNGSKWIFESVGLHFPYTAGHAEMLAYPVLERTLPMPQKGCLALEPGQLLQRASNRSARPNILSCFSNVTKKHGVLGILKGIGFQL